MVIRVPFTGAEKESLKVSLDRHRDAVLWKLEGLSDGDLRRQLVPSGTSLLGLVKHLGAVEYGWFCSTFGRPTEPLFDEDDPTRTCASGPRRPPRTPWPSTAARAAADQVIDELDVEDTGTAWFGDTVTMRWVLIHMVEETARHAGHVDVLREAHRRHGRRPPTRLAWAHDRPTTPRPDLRGRPAGAAALQHPPAATSPPAPGSPAGWSWPSPSSRPTWTP